ncbi:MAG: type II secretion system protein [Cyanobacteria bacterium SIG32]|nr:type II secretion system protein [Cyanobacteria bacterium SIG32]
MKKTVKNLITWSPSHLITSPKSAFTLAEVLITLAIIGVVAAMTIPTLVANYQTKAWNTSATVFERKLTEALKVMNTQQTLAGHKTTESFVEELSKHFKITKTCANDKLQECFSEAVYWGNDRKEIDMSKIKTAKHFGQKDWNTNIIGAQFANGTTALIAYNPTDSCNQDPYSNQITGENCLAILYDTSGAKSPNTQAKDLRANQNITSLGCAFEINGSCFGTAFIAEPHTWNACNYNTTSDPEDLAFMQKYGIKTCLRYSDYYDKDYWAGAVKACGGVSNMPSTSDLAQLVNPFYGTEGFTSGRFECENDIDCIKPDVIESYGIPYKGCLMIWSNSESNADSIGIRGYCRAYSYSDNRYARYGYVYSGLYTICKLN